MKQIEQILTDCLAEIRSGKTTVEECLLRFSEMRQELEPLLRMAAGIQPLPDYRMGESVKQSSREKLLRQIKSVRPPARTSFSDILSLGIPRQPAVVRAVASVLAIIMVILLAGGSTAYAAQNSLPGDALYPVKISTENVRLFIAGNDAAKAKLNIAFANRRLEELSQTSTSDVANAVTVVNRYRIQLENTLWHLRDIHSTTAINPQLEYFTRQVQSQINTCDTLIDSNTTNRPQIQEAGAIAFMKYIEMLEIFARYDRLKAAEYNASLMHNRLQRAQASAGNNDYQNMERELQQYNQASVFGQQLLDAANSAQYQDDQIKNLTLRQLASDLITLQSLSHQIPVRYRNMVNNYEQAIIQFQQHARYGQQGGTGPESSGPSSSLNDNQTPVPGDTLEDTQGTSGDNTVIVPPTTPPYHGGESSMSDNQTSGNDGVKPGGRRE